VIKKLAVKFVEACLDAYIRKLSEHCVDVSMKAAGQYIEKMIEKGEDVYRNKHLD
jgi:hypothetical protein